MSSVVAISPEVVANVVTAGNQAQPEIAVLGDGRLVVGWSGDNQAGELLRLFNPDGAALTGEIALGAQTGDLHLAADDTSTGFLATWLAGGAGVSNIMFGVFGPNGQLRGPPAVVYAGQTFDPFSGTTVAPLDLAAHGGGGVLAYQTTTLQRFGGPTTVDSVSFVSAAATKSELAPGFAGPAVASSNPQGVVWVADAGTVANAPVRATEYSFSGSQLSQVNIGSGAHAAVAALPGGHAAVAFEAGGDIAVAVVGGASVTQAVANVTTAGVQYDPAVAALADGRFVVAWTDTSPGDGQWDVRARVFNADGTAATGEFALGTSTAGLQADVALAAGPYGGFSAAWQGLDGDGAGIRVQAYDVINATMAGTAGNDVLRAGVDGDSLAGGAGDDWLLSGSASDVMAGGAGADKFVFALGGAPDRVTDFSVGEGDNVLIFNAFGAPADGSRALMTLDLGSHALTWDVDSDAGPATPILVAGLYGDIGAFGAANLAAGLQPSALRVIAPDRSRTETVFDWSHTQPFDHTVASFDPQLRLSEYDIFYDDGSKSLRWFDNLGSEAFTARNAEYDPQGRLSEYAVLYDDHSEQAYDFDTNNTQVWTRTVHSWATNGLDASFTIVYDTGNYQIRTFDPFNNQPYSVIVDDYDPNGHLLRHTIFNDDGSVTS